MSDGVIRECTHGMGNPKACFECMEEGPVYDIEPEAALVVEFVITAFFDDQCSGCNLPIHAGERVAKMSDSTYRHAATCVTPNHLEKR